MSVDWEEFEEEIIALSEEMKSASENFESFVTDFSEAVDEMLAELELSKEDYAHAIRIAKRYDYSGEGRQEEDDE